MYQADSLYLTREDSLHPEQWSSDCFMQLPESITGITRLAQAFAETALRPGDTAVDCTAGRGRDTLFLLEKTGPHGFVYAFDVQHEALRLTRQLLEKKGISPSRYLLVNDCHSRLSLHVKGHIAAGMFNLGYLPGGCHRITTDPHLVIEAVSAVMSLLRHMGILTIVLYPGHEPGNIEQQAVLHYAAGIDEHLFRVMHIRNINTSKASPSIVVIQKTVPTHV